MEYFVKVFIKSEDDLPKKDGVYFVCYKRYKEGSTHYWNTNLARKNTWLTEIDWYLKPVELPEITDNHFSGQPEHTEPPLELRICTRCNKEFKAIGACPICPSCYL